MASCYTTGECVICQTCGYCENAMPHIEGNCQVGSFVRELKWSGTTPISVGELRELVTQLQDVPANIKVNITVHPGDQRDPGSLSITVRLP